MLRTTHKAEEINHPFTYHLAPGVVPMETVALLEHTAPEEGSAKAEALEVGREKNYRMHILYLMYQSEARESVRYLSSPWKQLYDELTGVAFLDWLSDSTGLTLQDGLLDVAVYRHVAGDFISVHKDKPEKLLTAILYLNSDWPIDGGGAYEVRNSADPQEAPARSILPRPGNFLAFPPSSRSWHSVSEVRPGTPTRLTVQMEFWKQ
ncbi:2OG-Fe(II) oxygenase [Streptomyces sp. NPDC056831]|uniref:2OG-Fe(II) oxygenase n=1 Tax=Streptomyces sp. NPDC056831 TaxID=3345954 RepID=UPI0036A2832D